MKNRVKMSDFTRFLPDFFNLQKKNRRNLLSYSGFGGMWGSHSEQSEQIVRAQRDKHTAHFMGLAQRAAQIDRT